MLNPWCNEIKTSTAPVASVPTDPTDKELIVVNNPSEAGAHDIFQGAIETLADRVVFQ